MRHTKIWLALLGMLLALVPAVSIAAGTPPQTLISDLIPPSHMIAGVPVQGQWWNLSCEYAATSAATAFYGNQISQQTFVDDIGFDANPNKGFRGNLSGRWDGITDYGVYPAPILVSLKKHGFAHSYIFHSDTTVLKYAISQDHPVVVWIVGNFSNPPRSNMEQGGDHFFLVPYEHAVTVIGYTESGIQIMDPAYAADRTVSWQSFTTSWTQLDGMALAVVQ